MPIIDIKAEVQCEGCPKHFTVQVNPDEIKNDEEMGVLEYVEELIRSGLYVDKEAWTRQASPIVAASTLTRDGTFERWFTDLFGEASSIFEGCDDDEEEPLLLCPQCTAILEKELADGEEELTNNEAKALLEAAYQKENEQAQLAAASPATEPPADPTNSQEEEKGGDKD